MLFRLFALLLVLGACCGKKVILVSLDGFRHDYIEMAVSKNKNVSAFQAITSKGFRAMEVQNVMLTLTFPSHYSIATGRYVERHGLVGNHFYDKKINNTYTYTDAYKNLQPEWFTMNENEPIWLTNQRNGGKSCVVYWPASDSRMYGEMMYTNFGLYSSAPSLKFRIQRLMDWITQDDINFCMLYFNEPDHQGHAHGPNSPQVMTAVEQVNEGIAYLMQRLEQAFPDEATRPNLIVTSDHGMTTVNYKKVVDVAKVLPPSEYLFGVDGSPANLGVWPKTDAREFFFLIII